MGIYRKLALIVIDWGIWKIGRGFNDALMEFLNLPYDLLFDYGLGSAQDC